MREAPRFEVRAVGSLEQRSGCPTFALEAASADRLERLCRGECYYPSDTRRLITRIEVVRIRPQISRAESVIGLVEDPWRVYACGSDPAGCRVEFSDREFAAAGRDALYYVRAIEEPSQAVNAGSLRCERDARGECIQTHPCLGLSETDDCLAPTEERAWSSPLFVNYGS